jgi:hypothetical protein
MDNVEICHSYSYTSIPSSQTYRAYLGRAFCYHLLGRLAPEEGGIILLRHTCIHVWDYNVRSFKLLISASRMYPVTFQFELRVNSVFHRKWTGVRSEDWSICQKGGEKVITRRKSGKGAVDNDSTWLAFRHMKLVLGRIVLEKEKCSGHQPSLDTMICQAFTNCIKSISPSNLWLCCNLAPFPHTLQYSLTPGETYTHTKWHWNPWGECSNKNFLEFLSDARKSFLCWNLKGSDDGVQHSELLDFWTLFVRNSKY